MKYTAKYDPETVNHKIESYEWNRIRSFGFTIYQNLKSIQYENIG